MYLLTGISICLILFALSGLKSCLAADENICAFDFLKDFPEKYPPLILNDANREIVIPQEKGDFKGVIFNKGDKILFSCAGDDNNFADDSVNGNIPSKVVECIGNDMLKAKDEVHDLKSLACKTRAHATITSLNSDCANKKASLWQIGFNVTMSPTKSIWIPLITTCFDPKQSITYYSSHTISGKGLSASQDLESRPDFDVWLKAELYPDFSPNLVYKQEEQMTTITKLLGSQELAIQILTQSYLSRGHLAPNADFFFKVTADATFFYINVAPQWLVINSGVWADLEKCIRDLAKSSQLDYNIHTGTHNILALLDPDFKPRKVFLNLEKSQLPVPEFYWKVIEEPKSKKGIAFVSHNKVSDNFKFDWPCENICEDSNWDLDAPEDEFICCRVYDLKQAVANFPDVNVNGTLQGLNGSSAHSAKFIFSISISMINLVVTLLREIQRLPMSI